MDDLFAIQYYSMPESASSLQVTKSKAAFLSLARSWENSVVGKMRIMYKFSVSRDSLRIVN